MRHLSSLSVCVFYYVSFFFSFKQKTAYEITRSLEFRRVLFRSVLGDAEPDTVVDSGHGADRDSYLLAAPQMPLLEQHMGYPVVARIDDEPLDKPDRAVGGVDMVAASHRHFAGRDPVVGDGLREAGRFGVDAGRHSRRAQPVIRPGEHLSRAVSRITDAAGDEFGLLG